MRLGLGGISHGLYTKGTSWNDALLGENGTKLAWNHVCLVDFNEEPPFLSAFL
jgi:hypothetical protein